MSEEPQGRWCAHIQHDWHTDNKLLFAYKAEVGLLRQPGKLHFATGFTWQEVDEGTRGDSLQPLVVARRLEIKDGLGSFLQEVFDACWDHGMRPSGFKDFANELSAVRYHLEDMRKLAMRES